MVSTLVFACSTFFSLAVGWFVFSNYLGFEQIAITDQPSLMTHLQREVWTLGILLVAMPLVLSFATWRLTRAYMRHQVAPLELMALQLAEIQNGNWPLMSGHEFAGHELEETFWAWIKFQKQVRQQTESDLFRLDQLQAHLLGKADQKILLQMIHEKRSQLGVIASGTSASTSSSLGSTRAS